ncbi:MAG TPA: 6-phosphogluconolactonase [Steroidobacteraceae bacterium]|nr:6-phosphogluconolactonase [Steroidobacteraceae bacterium]
MSGPELHRFTDAATLLASLCARVSDTLRAAIEARGRASLLVSGGRTPAALFDQLSREALDWSKVDLGLVDERCVAPDSADSNENLVRSRLLQHRAAAANFMPMMNDEPGGARAVRAWRNLAPLSRPLDLVLLGMGDDGHTASWFPGSAALATALDPAQPAGCLLVTPLDAPHQRLTVNYSALLQSRRLVVLINGESKWRVYERAGGAGDTAAMPVRAILRQQQVPVDVYWSP